MSKLFRRKFIGVSGLLLFGVILSMVDRASTVTAQADSPRDSTRSLPSPFLGVGPCDHYLKAVHDGTDNDAMRQERRHAAIVSLEASKSTIEYLGAGLQYDLDDKLVELLRLELRTSAFADMQCVPGERCIVEACLKRAGRFGVVSIPALWRLVNEQQHEPLIKDRFRTHALHVLADLYRSAADKAEIRNRIKGQPDGAAIIEHLSCLDPLPAAATSAKNGE